MKRNSPISGFTTTGFTLVEVIVAISIFLIIMTISMGSILGIFDANRKGESQKTVTNSLNFAMETMSREMRYGKGYICDSTGSSNCPTSSTDSITFTSTLTGVSEVIKYYLTSSGVIMRESNGGTGIPLTGTDLTVTTLQFYVEGNNPPPTTTQPRVRIRLVGSAGSSARSQSSFVLQAVISQRDLNN